MHQYLFFRNVGKQGKKIRSCSFLFPIFFNRSLLVRPLKSHQKYIDIVNLTIRIAIVTLKLLQ